MRKSYNLQRAHPGMLRMLRMDTEAKEGRFKQYKEKKIEVCLA